MESIKEKYKLNNNITEDDLKNAGFRNGVYRSNLYKDMILFLITIDLNDKWWTYQVCNADANTLYVHYYNRMAGENELVNRLDKKIKGIFNNMAKQGIFNKFKK